MLKETLLKLFKLNGLVDHFTGYIEARLELVKYELKQDMAGAFSKIALTMIASFLVVLFVLFISVAGAFALGEELGLTAGFAIVGGIYFFLLLMVIIFKKSLSKKIQEEIKKSFIQKNYEQTGNGRSD